MATIRQGNARALVTLGDETHLRHALKEQKVREVLLRAFGFDLWQMPVCGGCERIALWHHDADGNPIGHCTVCGTETKQPLTVQQYYEQGLHTDRTMNPTAPRYIDRERVWRPREAATVYGGEAGLDHDAQIQIVTPSSNRLF